MVISDEVRGESPDNYIPRMIVARPRAVPIPLPLIAFTPVRLNLCKRRWWSVRAKCKTEWREARGLTSARSATYPGR